MRRTKVCSLHSLGITVGCKRVWRHSKRSLHCFWYLVREGGRLSFCQGHGVRTWYWLLSVLFFPVLLWWAAAHNRYTVQLRVTHSQWPLTLHQSWLQLQTSTSLQIQLLFQPSVHFCCLTFRTTFELRQNSMKRIFNHRRLSLKNLTSYHLTLFSECRFDEPVPLIFVLLRCYLQKSRFSVSSGYLARI